VHYTITIFLSFYNYKILSEVTNRRRLIIQLSKKYKKNETKRKIMVDIALHRKLRIEQQETHKMTRDALRYSGRASSSCSNVKTTRL
jgi:hypothetical protein